MECLHKFNFIWHQLFEFPRTWYFTNNFHIFRLERRRELSARYWFECQCLACTKNWQLLDALPKDPGFKDEKVEKVADFMAKGDVSSALDLLIPKLCETNALQEPTEEFIRLEDKLRTCINNFGSIILPNNK